MPVIANTVCSLQMPDLRRATMRRNIWCEGCGLGNMQQSISAALMRHLGRRLSVDFMQPQGIETIKNNIVMMSGIGCTSRMAGHLDVNTVHTTHGRSLAFASGLKMARPDLTVVLAAGDGDIFAIGGNHFIHAARRNLDMTLIVYDNSSYGMTGAQHSPTSPLGEIGASAPYGVFEPPFDLVGLAIGVGAGFVAQGAVTTLEEHQDQLEELIAAGLDHKGFSFINVIGACHTGWGTRNKRSEAFRYRQYIQQRVTPIERWRELSPEERRGLKPLGVIHRVGRPDLQGSPAYTEIVARAKKAGTAVEEPLEEVRLGALDPMARAPRTCLRFAGSGGQGVITAGEIALSAAVRAGKNGVFTKNYGPEARGGEAYSDVTVSDGEIHFPQTDRLDVLVALNQDTFDKFRKEVGPSGCILANTSAVRETYADARVIASPIGDILAREVRPPKRELGINILALAIVLDYLGLMSRAAIESAVMKSVGRKNPGLNQKALAAGFAEADRLKAQ
ncbi:MAG: thiamine pyrophosphate-dependent enzyme [Beijerinckiaceae bacterium]